MRLVNRDATVDDLDACAALLSDRPLYDARQLCELKRLWAHLLEREIGSVRVVIWDDAIRPRIVCFGASVFVSAERAERYHTSAPPGIARQLLAEWTRGDAPLLTRAQIAADNGGLGVNVLATHHGYEPTRDSAWWSTLRVALVQAFVDAHAGFNFRSFTHELYDPDRAVGTMLEDFAMRTRRYGMRELLDAGIPLELEPVVAFATRDDAIAHPGSLALASIFLTSAPPRFRFCQREQQVLRLALAGLTDDEIAVRLRISPSCIKKILRGAYDKVHDAQPATRPICNGAVVDGRRGAEVRRRLLTYLRDHPEELRPYDDRAAAPPPYPREERLGALLTARSI
jgi:hypothetical protein